MQTERELLVHRPSEGVVRLQLNRPARRNALTKTLVIDLTNQLSQAADEAGVRVVILSGDEKAFCAGADITEMNERGLNAIFDAERRVAWKSIEAFAKPMIAAVQGVALGAGNELAMMADLIVAGRSARFGQPESKSAASPAMAERSGCRA